MTPKFPRNLSIPITNYLTGATYSLHRVDEVEVTDAMLAEMVAIGNEPLVYSWLFDEMLDGKPYQTKNARDFFEMGIDGWRNCKMFVFLLLTEDGHPAACIDIKSADLGRAEIGYLASHRHRGVMTNTVVALSELAKEAGYKMLYGRVRKRNRESLGVLLRAGFSRNEEQSAECETYDFFELKFS